MVNPDALPVWFGSNNPATWGDNAAHLSERLRRIIKMHQDSLAVCRVKGIIRERQGVRVGGLHRHRVKQS